MRYLIISTIVSSFLFGKLTLNPTLLSFENSESTFAFYEYEDKKEYGIDRFFYLSTDINGVGWFFPKYLSHGAIGYKARYLGRKIDPYIFASNKIDLCKDNIVEDLGIPNTTPYNVTSEELIKLKETSKLKYISPREMFSLNLKESSKTSNFWFFAYPKTKKDFINSNGGIYPYSQPIICNYTYFFDKEKVDSFVENNSGRFTTSIKERCNKSWTYLNKEVIDNKLSQLAPTLQTQGLATKSITDFDDINSLQDYLLDIQEQAERIGDNNLKNQISSLLLETEAAKKKKEETYNFCLYINYLTTTPEYKISTLSLSNSCPCKGPIIELEHNIKQGFNRGYKYSGIVIKDGEKLYVKDNSNNFYKIKPSYGCDIKKAPLTNSQEKEEIEIFGTKIGEFINIHDWDNDTNLYYDCLILTDNKAYKLDKISVSENSTTLTFIPLIFKITKGNQAFIFNTTQYINNRTPLSFSLKGTPPKNIIEEKECPTSLKYEEPINLSNDTTTPSSEESLFNNSSSSTNNQVFQNQNSLMPSQSTIIAEENEISIPIDENEHLTTISEVESSANSSSTSNSSSSINNRICQIVKKLENKEIPINGYFAHYGDGAFDWIYLSSNGSVFAKLEGLDSNNYFKWTILKPYFSSISYQDNKIKVGKIISLPENEKVQQVVKKLENKEIPINGYFAHYGDGAFDWIYLSSNGSVFAKLEGLDSNNYLKWLLLQDYLRAYLERNSIKTEEARCR